MLESQIKAKEADIEVDVKWNIESGVKISIPIFTRNPCVRPYIRAKSSRIHRHFTNISDDKIFLGLGDLERRIHYL